MTSASFRDQYGGPLASTAADLGDLGLSHSRPLRELADSLGGGVFAGGFISLLSVREVIPSLGGWETWLPEGSRIFGCSAFGFLLATTGTDVWTIDTQYGQVVESDYSIPEVVDLLASDDCRVELLRWPLFERWSELQDGLEPTHVLSPTPVLPLGGTWAVEGLSTWTLPVYLSFMSQLFGQEPGLEVEVRRLAR